MDAKVENYIFEAEECFKANNFEKAVDFINKAKKTNPNLHEIDNWIIAYNVHKAAVHKRWNGEPDWYKILGVDDPASDFHTVKSKFNKLIMMVHPDKNSSVAAHGASILVNQAWEALKGHLDLGSSSREQDSGHHSSASQTFSNTNFGTSATSSSNNRARDFGSGSGSGSDSDSDSVHADASMRYTDQAYSSFPHFGFNVRFQQKKVCPKCEEFKGFSKPPPIKITCPYCGLTYKYPGFSM